MSKFYVQTDIDITITASGFEIADIESMQVQLVSHSNIVTLSTDDGITIGSDNINLAIGRDKVTQPGSYEVRMIFTDTEGKVRGLKSSPGYLLFA